MSGQVVGYVRVSSIDQNPARQLDGVEIDKKFLDKCSGSTTNRPALKDAMEYLREGDRLVVHALDRLGRNLRDLVNIVEHLVSKGVSVEFKKENLIFNGDDSPMSKLLLHIFGGVAEFELSLAKERQREGQQKAKAMGKKIGRHKSLTLDHARQAKTLRATGLSMQKVADEMKISRKSVYNLMNELKASNKAEEV